MNNPQIYLGVSGAPPPGTPVGVPLLLYVQNTQRATPAGVRGRSRATTYPQINLGVIHRVRLRRTAMRQSSGHDRRSPYRNCLLPVKEASQGRHFINHVLSRAES
ncbi:MAG: hypothetical protein LBP72_08805 [Dysgonamonadaceae bacterium]|nr:hypothetical protein [Dysgonamonadaceae bacterium]